MGQHLRSVQIIPNETPPPLSVAEAAPPHPLVRILKISPQETELAGRLTEFSDDAEYPWAAFEADWNLRPSGSRPLWNVVMRSLPLQMLSSMKLFHPFWADAAAQPGLWKRGHFRIKKWLHAHKQQLVIRVTDWESLQAAQGLILTFHLSPEDALVVYDGTIAEEIVRKGLPSMPLFKRSDVPEDPSRYWIRFIPGRAFQWLPDGELGFPMQPVHWGYTTASSKDPDVAKLKQQFLDGSSASSRQIVMVVEPEPSIVDALLTTVLNDFVEWNRLSHGESSPPLFVLTTSHRERANDLLHEMSAASWRTQILSSPFSAADQTKYDVLILLTSDQQHTPYGVADVVIAPPNSNILGPIQAGVPVLYSHGKWDVYQVLHSAAKKIAGDELRIPPMKVSMRIRWALENPNTAVLAGQSILRQIRYLFEIPLSLAIGALILKRTSGLHPSNIVASAA